MLEVDPDGIQKGEPGAKFDSGKLIAGSVFSMFSNALTEVVKVGTFGANKYSLGGWQHVEDGFRRYEDAQFRHALKRWNGEEVDSDSELLHLSHEAWNALAKLEIYKRENP